MIKSIFKIFYDPFTFTDEDMWGDFWKKYGK